MGVLVATYKAYEASGSLYRDSTPSTLEINVQASVNFMNRRAILLRAEIGFSGTMSWGLLAKAPPRMIMPIFGS